MLNLNNDLKNNENILDKLINNVETNPGDIDSRFLSSNILIANERYEDAINNLLEIIKIDRNWNEKKAHQLLLRLFSMLGSESQIAVQGRKKLAKLLF